jgi:RNA recognition motif-containing protein
MTQSGEANWSTIQVSNLPLETTRYQLEQLFEDLGPVKKCFVLKRKYLVVHYITFYRRAAMLWPFSMAIVY